MKWPARIKPIAKHYQIVGFGIIMLKLSQGICLWLFYSLSRQPKTKVNVATLGFVVGLIFF